MEGRGSVAGCFWVTHVVWGLSNLVVFAGASAFLRTDGNGAGGRNPGRAVTRGMGGRISQKVNMVEPEKLPSIKLPSRRSGFF